VKSITAAMLPAATFGLVLALLAGCTPAPAEPTAEPRENLTMTIGALLPDTGVIAAFGPGTRAAVQLAVDDVNAAGLPIALEVEYRDAGDSASETGVTSVADLLTLEVDAIVGPLSNGVSKKIIQTVVDAGVPMISPANNATDFTDFADDGLYWRTAPPCTLEGDVLAEQVAESGATTVGLLTQTEACGEALTAALTVGLERRDVEIVAEASLDDGGSIDAAVAAFVEEQPDAVVVATSQAKATIGPLLAAEFDGAQLFFLGLPPADYSADFAEGALLDAVATLPGPDLPGLEDFTDQLLEIDPALVEFSYTPEIYDAVILLALAALQGNSVLGADVAGQLQSVSGGAEEGEPCVSFAECADIIIAGGLADYEGLSGSITFDDSGDPAGAIIGVFRADRDNVFERID
jgi:branched-chain amino acid transport system substrate-binding protein